MNEPITVLIADDEAIVRDGLRTIIELAPDLEVVAEAADGAEAVAAARERQPQVALVDVQMPRLDGIETTRRLLALPAPPRVLILTTFDRNDYVYEAMKAGASGFLLKTAPARQLADAVRTVAAGDALLAPAITRRLVEQFVRRPPPGSRIPRTLEELTERELDVLRLLARARSNAEIAAELVVSEATVKSHVNRILGKLNLRDRAQAIVLAYESGLVEPGTARKGP